MFSERTIRFILLFLGFTYLIIFGPQAAWGAEKKLISWGTTATTSGVFTYYVAAAKFLNAKNPEMNVTVRAGAGALNVRLLEKNEIDMGSTDTKLAWEAIHGKGIFEGKPFPDLRLLYVNMTNPLQFVVSEKSGVKDIYGLEGKIFTPGPLGGTTETITKDIFRILGIHPNIRAMAYADALEAMKDERIVGFGKYGTPDSSILDIISSTKVRILSLSDSDIEKILKNVVGLRKVVVSSGMYPGVGEFRTVENEWSDFARKDFSPDIAYKIVKTIWENRKEIKSINSMFVGDRLVEVALGVTATPMHPGAIKYFREIGQTVSKNLIPPEMREK